MYDYTKIIQGRAGEYMNTEGVWTERKVDIWQHVYFRIECELYTCPGNGRKKWGTVSRSKRVFNADMLNIQKAVAAWIRVTKRVVTSRDVVFLETDQQVCHSIASQENVGSVVAASPQRRQITGQFGHELGDIVLSSEDD